MELSELSRKRLKGLHPHLIRCVETAASNSSFEILVVGGLRTVAEQRRYVAEGKSKTMNSRHLSGHAVDLVAIIDGKLEWGLPYNRGVAELMKSAARDHEVALEWGGDWSWQDPPHFQLSWGAYPKQDESWKTRPPAPVVAATKAAKKVTQVATRKAPVSLWGALAAGVTLVLDKLQDVIAFLTSTATELANLGPVSSMFAQAGANTKAITIGGIVLAASVVAKKLIEDDDD